MRHHTVDARGTRIHLVEEGDGPVVLLVHGFPESWYSWRHQLPAIAEAGFRAVAIDVRGYGRSSKPPDIEAYGMLQHVADNVGVVEALGEETAIIVGHDWGSPIAAHSALLRPDVFTGVALLSVAYSPPGRRRPTESFAAMAAAFGDEEFYINYFQEPGRAEAEIEQDVRSWLLGFYVGASGDSIPPADGGTLATVPRGKMLRDRFVLPEVLPAWLTEGRSGVLHGGVRAIRLPGPAQPLPQRGSGLGRTSPRGADRRSRCPRSSSAARRTGPPSGAPRPLPATRRRCPIYGAVTSFPAAVIGSNRNGPTSSTSC